MLLGRIERLNWLQKQFHSGYGLMGAFETVYVFEAARGTYLDGHFVATLVLVCAFIEHRFSALLIAHGFEKEARRGLKAMLTCMKTNRLAEIGILNKADRLRAFRNPFVHLQSHDHPHRLVQRSYSTQRAPDMLLKEDAEDALALMFQIALSKRLRF